MKQQIAIIGKITGLTHIAEKSPFARWGMRGDIKI